MGSPVSPNIAKLYMDPDSKVHGAIMGPIWGPQDPGMPHVGPRNLAIWGGVRNQGHAHSPEPPTTPHPTPHRGWRPGRYRDNSRVSGFVHLL